MECITRGQRWTTCTNTYMSTQAHQAAVIPEIIQQSCSEPRSKLNRRPWNASFIISAGNKQMCQGMCPPVSRYHHAGLNVGTYCASHELSVQLLSPVLSLDQFWEEYLYKHRWNFEKSVILYLKRAKERSQRDFLSLLSVVFMGSNKPLAPADDFLELEY